MVALSSLMMWRQPDSTLRLYVVLCIGFILSCILPGTTLFTIGGKLSAYFTGEFDYDYALIIHKRFELVNQKLAAVSILKNG